MKKIDDGTTRRLEELLMEHPEFYKLYANDATVHAWLKTGMTYQNRDYIGSAEEMLVGMIVALGNDKERMFDSHMNDLRNCTCNKGRPLI